MGKRKYQNAKKRKRFIEIRTNKHGWTIVELISINKGGTITIKLKGQLIKRKATNVRWSIKYLIPARPGVSRSSIEYSPYKVRKRYKLRKGKSKPVKRLNVPFKPKSTSLDNFIKDVNKKAKR